MRFWSTQSLRWRCCIAMISIIRNVWRLSLKSAIVTVWPAFTEAMYVLNFSWRAQDALWELILDDRVRLLPVEADDHRRMRDLIKKYRMLPMDVTDAALVAVMERERIRRIFTVDRRDFSLYRLAKLGKF